VRLNRIHYNENNEQVAYEDLEISDASLIGRIFQGNAERVAILSKTGEEVIWQRLE
jgi:hypothetical protein